MSDPVKDASNFENIVATLADVRERTEAHLAWHAAQPEPIPPVRPCEEEVEQASEYRHFAYDVAVTMMDQSAEAGNCLEDRADGTDCDHVTSGLPCPFAGASNSQMEYAAHLSQCLECSAMAVVDSTWGSARDEETEAVVAMLTRLLTEVNGKGRTRVARVVTRIIGAISAGEHRGKQ